MKQQAKRLAKGLLFFAVALAIYVWAYFASVRVDMAALDGVGEAVPIYLPVDSWLEQVIFYPLFLADVTFLRPGMWENTVDGTLRLDRPLGLPPVPRR